jgi:radical SAM-linked protein
MRIRITFAKTEAMRYTSHLDLHRTWERLLRRASLPLAYTQGYNPHPRINLAAALPLGFTSECEVVDIHLERDLPVGEIYSALRQAAPPGLEIHRVEEIPPNAPVLQSILEASEYTVTLLDPLPELEPRLGELLSIPSLPRVRRGKNYDLRPLIHAAVLIPPDESGCQRLHLRLSAREGATGRPEEVLLALGGDPLSTRVHRTRLIFRAE